MFKGLGGIVGGGHVEHKKERILWKKGKGRGGGKWREWEGGRGLRIEKAERDGK